MTCVVVTSRRGAPSLQPRFWKTPGLVRGMKVEGRLVGPGSTGRAQHQQGSPPQALAPGSFLAACQVV